MNLQVISASKSVIDIFNTRRALLIILSILIPTLFIIPSCQDITIPSGPGVSTPPAQAFAGPGGSQYLYENVKANTYGTGEHRYWIFEPVSTVLDSAPLIIFNHGWLATNPQVYGAWIHHLVRRGNIVVYPQYQNIITDFGEMTGNAMDAVKDAIAELQNGEHIKPQLDKIAIVGHSMGGIITANMAALYAAKDLPEPKALMLVESARGIQDMRWDILTEQLDLIPKTILMLVLVGSEDTIAGVEGGKKIFYGTPQIPLENKDFITINSDYYGKPSLTADHFAPLATDYRYNLESVKSQVLIENEDDTDLGSDVDTLDYYGFWKLFDGVTDSAFYGQNREYALGNTPEQRFMSTWSDGTPVKELEVTKEP